MYQMRNERAAHKRKRRIPSPSDKKPQYVNRDMSPHQSDDWDPPMQQLMQDFNGWHLRDNYYQPTIDVDIYSRLEGDVTTLVPLVIPKQPEAEWFNVLADTPAVTTPLETLEWLCMPDSPSLGKRMYDSETGPSSPTYQPAEYNTMTGPTRLTELSGLIGQDNLEDCEAKKARI